MMKCRWWDSNPHGFPNDFESFASAIPPHRLIFNFETFVPVSEDWRDVRNPASTNLQNSTHNREFLVQTRKITKRILSFCPHLPSGVIQWYLVISGSHCAKAKFTPQRIIIWNIHDFSMRFPPTLFFRFGPPKRKLEGCSGGMQGKTLLCLGTKRKESQG